MRSQTSNLLAIATALLLAGCVESRVMPREAVLERTGVVEVNAGMDRVRVSYVDELSRDISINGFGGRCKCIAREKRFEYPGMFGRGILGIYDPACGMYSEKDIRIVYSENIKNLSGVDEFKRYMREGSAV